MRKLTLLLVVFLSFYSAYAQNKEEKKLIVDQIIKNDKKLEMFWEKSNVDSLANMYTSNCDYIAEYNKIISTSDEIKKKIAADFKAGLKVIDLIITPSDHNVYDDLVIEVGTRSIKYTNALNKLPVTEIYNYQIVWKKTSNGRYRIKSEIWNLTKKP